MSSPLDSRMRAIAREEATALLGVPSGASEAPDSTPTAEQMQQQITDLHEHLHHAVTAISALERRISALEDAPERADRTARRAPRKAGSATTTPE